MTTLQEAYNIILSNTVNTKTESVSMAAALGRVLAEPLLADRDFPPFDRVTMDGIAIVYKSFEEGQRAFQVGAIAPAGTPQVTLDNPKQCVEVMTGAVLPKGTDTVIRYEDIAMVDNVATIQVHKLKFQQNIHGKGSDRLRGDLLVASGCVICPGEIGIAATIGKSVLEVNRPPRTVIISTGDELVRVDEEPEAHQIRRSNVHTLIASLQHRGVPTDELHLNDDRSALVKKLKSVLDQYELLILSGGVSKGKFDYVPEVLEELGIAKLFHGVAQRPGKPFWFGTNGQTVVFALPGNPVSSYMCTLRYIQPWLDKVLGLPEADIPYAILTEDFLFKPDLTYLLQVQVQYSKEGQILAQPLAGGGSGDLANLSVADAFLELPRGRELFKKGEAYALYQFR